MFCFPQRLIKTVFQIRSGRWPPFYVRIVGDPKAEEAVLSENLQSMHRVLVEEHIHEAPPPFLSILSDIMPYLHRNQKHTSLWPATAQVQHLRNVNLLSFGLVSTCLGPSEGHLDALEATRGAPESARLDADGVWSHALSASARGRQVLGAIAIIAGPCG